MARVEICWQSTPDERRRIGTAVHTALVEALKVPADDPTVIVIERDPDGSSRHGRPAAATRSYR